MSKTIDINSSNYGEREAAFSAAFEDGYLPEYLKEVSSQIVGSSSLSAFDFANRDPLPMVSTGLPSIDHILGGGISSGQSIGIGGIYGGGKSVLLLQIASNLAKAGAAVLYATPELTREEIYARCAARYMDEKHEDGVHCRPAYLPSFGEIRRVRDYKGAPMSAEARELVRNSLQDWHNDVGDRFNLLRYREGDSLSKLKEGVDLFYETAKGGLLKVVVVDPIQRLAPMRPKDMADVQYESILKSEHERIALTATQVKDLADGNKTVVLFGSDANAGVMNPTESASAGFRGGAKVGNAATTMLFISKPNGKEDNGQYLERVVGERGFVLGGNPCLGPNGEELTEDDLSGRGVSIVSTFKNREGPGGFMGMHLRGAYSRFIDCAKIKGTQGPATVGESEEEASTNGGAPKDNVTPIGTGKTLEPGGLDDDDFAL